MKTNLFTLIFALAASVGSMFAWDFEHVQIGDLYYNLDAEKQTAEVTSQNSDYPYWETSITVAEIPSSVTYNEVAYSVTSIGYAAFSDCQTLTSVTIPNSVTSIGALAFKGCKNLTSLAIPNGVTIIEYGFCSWCESLSSLTLGNALTSIGDNAFNDCHNLNEITFPHTLTSIGYYAFSACGLYTIICEAVKPPLLEEGALGEVDDYDMLYVLEGSVNAYRNAEGWKDFNPDNILPIEAEKRTDATTPEIDPYVTAALVIWPVVKGAASYELVVKDTKAVFVCSHTFNDKGQLTDVSYNAPARHNDSQLTQSDGFAYVVNGLEPGTKYNFSIIAKNAAGATIDTQTGSFTTLWPESVDQIRQDPIPDSQKLLMNGHILIRHSNRLFTLHGQEVK